MRSASFIGPLKYGHNHGTNYKTLLSTWSFLVDLCSPSLPLLGPLATSYWIFFTIDHSTFSLILYEQIHSWWVICAWFLLFRTAIYKICVYCSVCQFCSFFNYWGDSMIWPHIIIPLWWTCEKCAVWQYSALNKTALNIFKNLDIHFHLHWINAWEGHG